jgi:hypothetical protein
MWHFAVMPPSKILITGAFRRLAALPQIDTNSAAQKFYSTGPRCPPAAHQSRREPSHTHLISTVRYHFRLWYRSSTCALPFPSTFPVPGEPVRLTDLVGINFTMGCLPPISNSAAGLRANRAQINEKPKQSMRMDRRVRERTTTKGNYDASWGRSCFSAAPALDKLPHRANTYVHVILTYSPRTRYVAAAVSPPPQLTTARVVILVMKKYWGPPIQILTLYDVA